MTDESKETVVRGERFSTGPVRGFLSSMEADAALFEADLAVDRAHVVMLTEQDIIAAEEAAVILDGLKEIESDGYEELPDAEDIHEAIETALIDKIGSVGGKLHTARSRNDEVATCIRYHLRELLLDLAMGLLDVREALAEMAEEEAETLMPGYTHLQPAQPTTVGHWALSYERALARDTQRLNQAYTRVNQSPLGAGAFAGTSYPIDPAYTAELLGFDGHLDNAMDAVSSRDIVLESLGIANSVAVTLSGLAADVIHFSNRGFITLDDDYASTSSIMPQKKNPDTFELVRACTGDSTGAYNGVSTILKGLPRAYNRDLQSVTPKLVSGLTAVTAATNVTAGGLVTAQWEHAALESAADEGLQTATDLADHLTMAGVPFREAHSIVATATSAGHESMDAVIDVVTDELDSTAISINPADLTEVLTPSASVENRNSPGGPAPQSLLDQQETVNEALATDREAISGLESNLDSAQEKLATTVDTLQSGDHQ